jgi:uncharacterized protein (TIGR03067 family)
VLAAGLLAWPVELQADDNRSDADALQGTWQMVCQQRAGRSTARPKNMKWVIEGDTIWLVIEREPELAPQQKKPTDNHEVQLKKGGKGPGPQRGLRMSFRLDPTKTAKHIDIDGPGKAIHCGIYRLDGDELTICMGVSMPSPNYDKKAKKDQSTRPAVIDPEAGTVIVLKRIQPNG